MKVFKQSGSKDRLFEVMRRVNGVTLNEEVESISTPKSVLSNTFNGLLSGDLKISHSTTKIEGDETFVELTCTDKNENNAIFRFIIKSTETDQENVFGVNDIKLIGFTYATSSGDGSFEINDEDGLREFNSENDGKLFDVIEDYVDVSEEEPVDSLYEDAIKKIDSYPYGGGSERMQTAKAYVDEKPTNPKLRVSSDELDKYIKESENIGSDVGIVKYVNHHFDRTSPTFKNDLINAAMGYIATHMNLNPNNLSKEKLYELIRSVAGQLYVGYLTSMNENDYPSELGKEFSSDTKYPKPKKKITKKVKIKEDDGDDFDIPDLDIPNDSKAKNAAMSDISSYYDDENGNVDDIIDINEDDNQIKKSMNIFNKRMDFNKLSTAYSQLLKLNGEIKNTSEYNLAVSGLRDAIVKYFDMNGVPAKPDEIQRYFYNVKTYSPELREDAGESNDMDVEQLAKDREIRGDQISGGLGDDKSPLDFNKEQIKLGMKVEMEHSDDPMIALEIALDHLSEDPQYYTVKDDPEASAQFNAAKDGVIEKNADDKMTDVLLGYKPKNVGDGINEEHGFEEYQGEIGDKYIDDEGNKYVVREKRKGGVLLRTRSGDTESSTRDLKFMKKITDSEFNKS